MINTKAIPEEIANAVVSILTPYVEEVSVERLEEFFSTPVFDEPEALLTRKEAAKRLSVSLPTVDRLLRSGELRSVKIRHSVRIPESAIQNLITTGKRGEVSDAR